MMESTEELVEIIYEGHNFDDPVHLNSLYEGFKNVGSSNVNGNINEPDELERIKAMKNGFQWIPVPKHYFTRFQKSSEMSTLLREKGIKYLHSNTNSSSSSVERSTLLKALRGCNLSIAFAPLNSCELALGLEKRADLLVRLEEPELAQIDIESASRNMSYPRKCAQKLIELQNRCSAMTYAKETEKIRMNIKHESCTKEIIKYTESQFFSLKRKNPGVHNLSEFAEIDYKPHCGRRIIASKHVKPGEVLMIDEPYALILEAMLKWDLEHCTNCSKPILAGIPCNYCTFGWFCSKSCLEEGNRGLHKYEHNYLSYLKSSQIMSLKGLLASRILFKVGHEELYRIFQSQDPLYFNTSGSDFDPRYRGYDGNGIYSAESYLPIYHLISHPHVNILKSKSNAFKALILANLIEDTSDFFIRLKHKDDFEEFKDFITSLLLRHMESIDYNAITLSQMGNDGNVLRYGAGVFPVLCLINHSCDPNCVPVRSLRYLKTAVVAMKSLKPGDEVTFSYAPHFSQMETGERRKFLFDKYNFICICEACSCSWGPDSRTVSVPESQCNTCGKYLLIGQCPKCTLADQKIKKDLILFKNRLKEVKELVGKTRFLEAMELLKTCLLFTSDSDKFANNFNLGMEFQELFKIVLVALVSL